MSNKLINIGGDENDANYRYKMPPLTTKIEGRGNGIKTVLMNVSDVAKALHTEPSYATKFFGMEVGALSQYDKVRNVGIVHGVHHTKDLQVMLKKYIKEFILCRKCKLPELQFKVHQKKNVLLQKCASCGWKGSNASSHKVKTYIINHPPVKKDKKKSGGDDGDKDSDAKKKKKTKTSDKDADTAAVPDATIDEFKELGWDDDAVWSVDTSDDAVAKRKQEEMATIASKNKPNKAVPTEEDVAAATATTTDTKKKSKNVDQNAPSQILRNYIQAADRNNLEIMDEIRRISMARNFDQKKKLQLTIDLDLALFIQAADRNNLEIMDEIRRISMARNFDQKKKLQLTIDALCKLDTMENLVDGFIKYKAIFSTFTQNKNDCHIFLGVVEEFVCRRNPDAFLGKVYKILECLYDSDIVEDEYMLEWAALETDKALIVDQEEAVNIREKAAPFIKWLKENQDDDDDTDDDDEEEEES
eukprot:CAMPEP_0202727500 /NCGR_PEP_ID=MMETSP1385-20130828/185154_1 /ASSEMBLY_ACC=CAM_ASM_000861 /TAXON_ID=933848 /ORGANISM="Elphidium margaritaceum" /LENGTH=472 /DNA_ID=CAMNT_0049393741 /DNA_START=73 /DNA_END=1492 /DNA_ORIENTATION=+